MAMLFNPEEWAAVESGVTFGDLVHHCDVLNVGIDGGGIDGLLSVAIVGRHRQAKHLLLLTRTWARVEVLSRFGLADLECPALHVVAPAEDEYSHAAVMVAEIKRGARRFGEVGLSPHAPGALMESLTGTGVVTVSDLAAIGRFSVRAAAEALRRRVRLKRIEHSWDRLLGWSIGATTHTSGGNISAPHEVVKTPLMAVLHAVALDDHVNAKSVDQDKAMNSIMQQLFDEAMKGNASAIRLLTGAINGGGK